MHKVIKLRYHIPMSIQIILIFIVLQISFYPTPALSQSPPPPSQSHITIFQSEADTGTSQSLVLFPDAIIGVRMEWFRQNHPSTDYAFTAKISYPHPEAQFYTDASHTMTWDTTYIHTCTHDAEQHFVECTGVFPSSDPTQILNTYVEFYVIGTCELYPEPPAQLTVTGNVTYNDDTQDTVTENLPVAPRINLETSADSPADGAEGVIIEHADYSGAVLHWHDQTEGYVCAPKGPDYSPLEQDITYGVYLNKVGDPPNRVGRQDGECTRQVQLYPHDLSCDENGEPQIWEWTVRAIDVKYALCSPSPYHDSTFRFTTASCKPEITNVMPVYGNQYFLKNIKVDNTYRVEVDWNGPAYQPSAGPIDGSVHFELNGVEKPEGGVSGQTWGAEHTFNMGEDFKADWSGGNNAMKIWAECRPDSNSAYYKSDYQSLQPIVFPFPEWATTVPIGPFTIDAKQASVNYENEAEYPDPAFEASVDVPKAVPYLGGKKLGILESQAKGNIAASSSGAGKLGLEGQTGLGLGAFNVVGEIGGEGEFKFQTHDGLKMNKAKFKLSISTPFSKDMTLADLIPAVKAAEDWWLVGDLIRKVTRSIVVEGSITPKINIAADFEQEGRKEWVFVGSVLRGDLELKVVATFKPYEKLWVQVYGGGTPFLEINVPANPNYFKRMGIDLIFGAKLHAWRWEKEFKYGVTCALPGGCASNDDARRARLLQGEEGWRLMPRDYVTEDYNRFVGRTSILGASTPLAPGATAESPLVANVYPLTEPAFAVRADGHQTLAYIIDDPSKPVGQGEELTLLQGYELRTATPLMLTDDEHLDFSPQVVYDHAGNAVVVWERTYTDVITTGLTLTFAQQIDIAATSWLSDSATWQPITMLTENNGLLDHSPRLRAGQDGSVIALWQSGDGTDILGSPSHPISYTYATWDGAHWSLPQVAIGGLSQTLEMDIAVYSATQAALVYAADTDGDIASSADTELYYSLYDGNHWAAPVQLTHDTLTDTAPAMAYDATGTLKLVWLRGTDVVMLDGSMDINDAQTIRTDSTHGGFQTLHLSASPQGHMALIWQALNEEHIDLAYRVFDANTGRWGADQYLMQDDTLETALAPAFASDGTLYVSYRKSMTEYVTETVELSPTLRISVTNMPQVGRSDLYLLSHTVGYDLSISDLQITPPYPNYWDTVTLTARIHNTGDLEVGSVNVVFGYDGENFSNVTVAPTLTAGTWTTATTTWNVSAPLTGPVTLHATVDQNNEISETSEDNNYTEITTFGPRLVAEDVMVSYDTSTMTYTLHYENRGNCQAEAPITVTLRSNAPDGPILASAVITETVARYATGSTPIGIEELSLLAGQNDGWMVVGAPQADRSNAWPVDLSIKPDLTVTDIQGNPPAVHIANLGPMTATNVTLTAWRDVSTATLGFTDTLIHQGALVFNEHVGDLSPGQNRTLSLNLPSGDTPEIWANIDAEHAIDESDESNNLRIGTIHVLNTQAYVYITAPPTTTVNMLTHLMASTGPTTTTVPLTYTWQATGHNPIVHTDGTLSDTLNLAWVTTGTQYITVTAQNTEGVLVTDTHELDVLAQSPGQCHPVQGVRIHGPSRGVTQTAYTFIAEIEQPASLPVLYTWDPAPHPDSIMLPTGQSVVSYTWNTPGTYTLTVVAQNCAGRGQVTATHTIYIPASEIYLPLMQVVYAPPPVPDRYVKRYGESAGDCSTPETACATIQQAIDQAAPGDLIGIAGYSNAYEDDPSALWRWTYWATESRPKPQDYYGPDTVSQVAYISKTVTLYGGYNSTFTEWDPEIYQSVIRPGDGDFAVRGVLVTPGVDATLAWLHIIDGDASYQGGAYNIFHDYQSAGGGVAAIGTYAGSDTLTIKNCVISGNIASNAYNASGGGIYLRHRDHAILENNQIFNNTATAVSGQPLGQGGGINISSSDNVIVRKNIIHDNIATTGYGRGEGAGIWASSSDYVQITANTIYSNTSNDNGGGIHIRGSDHVNIQGNRIYNNMGATQADGIGGGIELFGVGTVHIQDNEIFNNFATQSTDAEHVGIGGGIYLNDVTNAMIARNYITGNIANPHHLGTGGGIGTYQCRQVTLEQNYIVGNIATPNHEVAETAGGGGIRISNRGTGMGGTIPAYATLINNFIVGNQAPFGGGGLLLLSLDTTSRVTTTMLHNTIADNLVPPAKTSAFPDIKVNHRYHAMADPDYTASHSEILALAGYGEADNKTYSTLQVPIEAQGLLIIRGIYLEAHNTIISGHTRGIYIYDSDANSVSLDYTLWHNNTIESDPSTQRSHDRAGDPSYIDPASGDYHIDASSAAKDQGTDAGVYLDIDSDLRPQGSGYDIGADELVEEGP